MSTPPWADPFEAELGRLPEKLRRFFLSRGVRTEDEALDLVQETLLRVLQRVSRGDHPLDSPEAFSLGVAKNVFLEYCRRVQRANKHEGLSGVLDLAGTEDPLSDALASSRKLIVRKALELIPARMRVLLVRRFVEEVPSRTIAREEGVTTDAVGVIRVVYIINGVTTTLLDNPAGQPSYTISTTVNAGVLPSGE